MKDTIFVSGSNYFNNADLQEMIKLLDDKKTIEVGISCIGHTKNNMEQENYKDALLKHYGKSLNIKKSSGIYSYSYEYNLKCSIINRQVKRWGILHLD